MTYEKELETYQGQLPALLATDEGKYAVIKNDAILGVYGTYEDALNAGYKEYGLVPFLVKQITAIEQIQYFTRELAFA